MARQLARDVKISLGLLNVHLCFAVGRNIYDYGGKTVLAVRQFLLLHSPRCTVKRGSRTKVIISPGRKAAKFYIVQLFYGLQSHCHCYVIFNVCTNIKKREKDLDGFDIDVLAKEIGFLCPQITALTGQRQL